jgi:hypothetical protein
VTLRRVCYLDCEVGISAVNIGRICTLGNAFDSRETAANAGLSILALHLISKE